MADVQIAVIDQQNVELTLAVPGIQGPTGQTGSVATAQDGTAALPGIRFENDTNTGIYRPGADQVAISTNGTGRLFVDSNGTIRTSNAISTGVGATTGECFIKLGQQRTEDGPSYLAVYGQANASSFNFTRYSGANGVAEISNQGAGNINIAALGAGSLLFTTNSAERARIDSSGRLLIGTSSDITGNTATSIQTVQLNGPATSALGRNGSSIGTNQELGRIYFYSTGGDGTTWELGASIAGVADGTHATGDKPTRLVFSVTADGASSPTEAMRIKNTRVINFSNAPVYADNAAAKTGGLVDGDVYRTSTGDLKIVYT